MIRIAGRFKYERSLTFSRRGLKHCVDALTEAISYPCHLLCCDLSASRVDDIQLFSRLRMPSTNLTPKYAEGACASYAVILEHFHIEYVIDADSARRLIRDAARRIAWGTVPIGDK